MGQSQAALVLAAQGHPPATGSGALSVTDTSTTEQDLSAFEGQWVMFISTEPIHISFGVTGIAAADTSDVYWPKDTVIERFIPRNGSKSFFRAVRQGATSATLYWAEAGK